MEIRMATEDFDAKARELHALIPTHGHSARLAVSILQDRWQSARANRHREIVFTPLSPSHDAFRAVGLM